MERDVGLSARIAVDACMAAVLVAVMSTALSQEAPHEYLGIALLVLVIAHLVLNHRWFGAIARRRYDVAAVIQLVLVAGALACTIGLAASSVVISKHALGFLPALSGAAMARRVHMLCSYWMFVLACAHAGFQLPVVVDRVAARRRKAGAAPTPAVFAWVVRAVCVAAACAGIASAAALDLPAYLLGRMQFAFVDLATPIALTFARHASVAALIATAFYYLRRALGALLQ